MNAEEEPKPKPTVSDWFFTLVKSGPAQRGKIKRQISEARDQKERAELEQMEAGVFRMEAFASTAVQRLSETLLRANDEATLKMMESNVALP